MTPAEKRFAKTVTVYKSDKFISIETLSGVPGLNYRENESHPTYLDATAANEMLGEALLAALDRSRFIRDKEFLAAERAMRLYIAWKKEFARRNGFETVRHGFRKVDWCMVKIRDGNMIMEPHRRDKPASWRLLPPEKTVVIPYTRDVVVVGAALREALNRCE